MEDLIECLDNLIVELTDTDYKIISVINYIEISKSIIKKYYENNNILEYKKLSRYRSDSEYDQKLIEKKRTNSLKNRILELELEIESLKLQINSKEKKLNEFTNFTN
jgi:hypothetical protein